MIAALGLGEFGVPHWIAMSMEAQEGTTALSRTRDVATSALASTPSDRNPEALDALTSHWLTYSTATVQAASIPYTTWSIRPLRQLGVDDGGID
ncbi:MAG: hypothetical protein ACT4NY_27005 [Pseudonocardiales bacterium]